MAVTNKCQFPHDLNYAIKLLEADLGDRIVANQQLLKDVESLLPSMATLVDEGNSILDQLLSKNGAGTTTSSDIVTSADVATQYGLLPDNPTTEDEEKFVANAGVILLNNIVYLSGDKSDNPRDATNISILRRLYFSLGRDLSKVESILATATKTVFVHDQLVLKVLPAKSINTAYSLSEIRTLLQQPQLDATDYAVTSDGRSIVLLKSYLTTNTPKNTTISRTGVPTFQLISNAFHLNGVDTSTPALNWYTSMGYTGYELNSIMLGQDLITSNPLVISTTVDNLHAVAASIVSIIEFVQSRINTTPTQMNDFYNQINLALNNLINNHQGMISMLEFEVSLYLDKDILTKLREKHTDAQIIYLLERRKDIKGLFFTPTDDAFLADIRRSVSAAPPGSTYISNQAINKPDTTTYDQEAALTMYAHLLDAQAYLALPKSYNSLEKVKTALNTYIGQTPIKTTTTTTTATTTTATSPILQGQPSASSPSSILTERVDALTTMNFNQKKADIQDSFKDLLDIYPASVAGALSDVINSVVDIFEKAFRAIDSIISQAEKTLFAMKNRLDSWISKHASLTGQGNFSSSLLKCSINWDIGLSTDLLNQLFDFLMKFVGMVLQFLTKMKNWISDLLTRILCMPVNLLNSFLGKVQTALPSACRIPKFDLGVKLNTSLAALNKIGSFKTIMLQSFGTDVARLTLSVSAAPDRLGQFKTSAMCESSATSNFMNASNLNVSAGIKL